MKKPTNGRSPLYLDQLPGMPNLPRLEEEVQDYWQKNQVFTESVKRRPKSKSYVFYDGPPFATGTPHYGHLVASTTKDVIPRYWTMKGFRVERQWGWDCHGLPIENILEKELKLPDRKSIEAYGVAKFNQACRNTVLKYAQDWKTVINRLGRWVDMENDYKTMETWYMESLWWVFSQLWQKGLIYQDYKPMHICPRCSTPLSNFEVTQGYKEVTDPSVYVEFLLDKNSTKKLGVDSHASIFLLAWTTTPWTLPGNLALAVHPKARYVLFSSQEKNKLFIVAEPRLEQVVDKATIQIIKTFSASDLVGLSYEPLFSYFAQTKNGFKVHQAEFVTMEEGTGIVHIAPGFGEDDFNLAKVHHLPVIQHVDMAGKFTNQVKDFAGLSVKPLHQPISTDQLIIDHLEKNDRVWDAHTISHSYPHCWRCDTPLLNYATKSWFIKVTEFKDQLLKNNQEINWVPAHIKDGRFGTWLENARDWAISRNRFWGTPLPIWQAEDGESICISSLAELEKLSGQKLSDIHKDVVDEVVIVKNQKKFWRVPEVLDCWFESGAMPYASFHYPFKNKAEFEQNFPAEFISEGQDQTRGWFYTLHVLATALTMGDQPSISVTKSSSSFKNVIVNGVILASDGKKMSKKLKNYPDPMVMIDRYGVDSLRLYLMSSPVMRGENLNFNEKIVSEIRKKVFLIWWNVLAFYRQFADPLSTHQRFDPQRDPIPTHVMDQWILSRLSSVHQEVEESLDSYDLVSASRSLMWLVDELSTWYIRRSRDRFRHEETQAEAVATLGFVLYRLAQLFAPITPFFSELVAHNLLPNQDSIHLTDWPTQRSDLICPDLEANMLLIRKVAEKAHGIRKEANIRVRQPLAKLSVKKASSTPRADLLDVLAEEINVKQIEWQTGDGELDLSLDIQLTPDLIAEGEARELIRSIQQLRKVAGLQASDQVEVQAPSWPTDWKSHIEKTTHTRLVQGDQLTIIAAGSNLE